MIINPDSFYSKIPNCLFYSTDNDKSIIQLVKNYKVLLIFDYLYVNTNRKDDIKFTLQDMILSCGYKPDSRSNRTNQQFKDILIKLKDNLHINSDFDFHLLKPNDLVCCCLNVNLKNKYMELYEPEKELILSYSEEKIDTLKLLVFYCYIKCRTYKRSIAEGDLVCNGGRAECCWLTYQTISDDLYLTDETISKYNDILVKLNMIRIDNAGLWYIKDSKFKTLKESPNFYTLFNGDEDFAALNLKSGIKYYKSLDCNANKVFTNNRTYFNNNRSLNGKLGSIVKKEKSGKATQDDIAVKNAILAETYIDEQEFKIKSLLDKYPDETLNQIYADLNKEELSDKYYNIELELGLINHDCFLLVDRDYYSWVLSNYHKNTKQYLINCIAKHKRESSFVPVNPTTGEVLEYDLEEWILADDVNVDEPANDESVKTTLNISESEPSDTLEDKLPWKDDGNSMFETEMITSNFSDDTQETEEQRKKRIANVWGFDPDVPESINSIKQMLNKVRYS